MYFPFVSVVDAALRTSAAPTFFPIYQGFIDGGVIANNPSMCALAQALSAVAGSQSLRDIRLLSVGTGANPKYLEQKDEDWGLMQWAPNLVSLMLEGSVGLADYQCRQALQKRYHRLNPYLPIPIGLDGIAEIPRLKDIAARENLTETVRWLKRYFRAN